MLRTICKTLTLTFIDRPKLPGSNTMSKSIHRLALVVGIGCFAVFTLAASVALADGDDPFTAAKKEFVEKFEKFKKEGLTAAQVKELTDQLLEAAGDKIDGTGTETLLKTMNKQAANTVWLMKKKESIEELIDFVGDVYAMTSSDTPPDPVEAYKALSKGVGLAAKLADKMPVMKVIAVPMLKAYAQAIKNGEKHIEAIAAATKAKNSAIELGWRSMDYDEALAETEMDEAEDDEPTEEELQWEADRIKRQAAYGECLSKCSEEYNAYDKASVARSHAWKRVANQKELLDKNKLSAKTRRARYNALIPDYKGSRIGYRKALKKRDNERARMQRAKSEGNEQGYLARKEMLKNYEKDLVSWKENLHKDYKRVSQMHSKYLEAKIKAAHTRGKYNSLLEAYKKIDSDFKKAKAAFDACIELCNGTPSAGQAKLLGPTPYFGKADSPFQALDFKYYHLEDFEDHVFNAPGVSASAGAIVTSSNWSGDIIDSVDGDDGSLDGPNLPCKKTAGDCDSMWASGSIKFTFDANALGSLPTHAGLVWTDGGGTITFEAFDGAGNSLGVKTYGDAGDSDNWGKTGEDCFFGAMYSGGIGAIRISSPGGMEVDHLQYGSTVGAVDTSGPQGE